MDFIYGILADFYIVFLVLGIVFAIALLGFLSKVSKRKEKKNEVVEEAVVEPTKQESTLPTIQMQPPGSLVIDTPHKPVEEQPEVILEPSLDDLEIKAPDPEPVVQPQVYTVETQNYAAQPMPQVQYTDPNQMMMATPQVMPQQQMMMDPQMTQNMYMTQPMPQVQYTDPNQMMMATPQVMPQQQMMMDPQMAQNMYMTQPMPQVQYTDPNQMMMATPQVMLQQAMPQHQMMMDPQMAQNMYMTQPMPQVQYTDSNQMMMPQQEQMVQQPVQQQSQMETIEFLNEPSQQQETIEFFEVKEQNEEPVVPQEKIELRKFDINQANALAQELASKQPANMPDVIDAEPTFGLVIEDTGASVGTNV